MYSMPQAAASTDTLCSLGYESQSQSKEGSSEGSTSPAPGHTPRPRGDRTPPSMSQQRNQVPLRKGHSPRNEVGDVMVLTPWYPDGLPKSGVHLADEIRDFAGFVSLTGEESAVRERVVTEVATWIRSIWPGAQVGPYGSFAYDASLPSSALDVMADHCGDLGRMRARLRALAPSGLRVVNLVCNDGAEGTTPSAFLQLEAPGGLAVNVAMVCGQSQAQQAAALCRDWLQKFPAASAVATTVRHVLGQAKIGDVRNGGLSSYAVLMMVVHVCRRVPDPSDAGAVLLAFLQEFGSDLRYDAEAVSPLSGAPTPRGAQWDAQHQLVVLDPLNPANNLAWGCSRAHHVRSQFQHCLLALRRWSDVQQQRRGYKGRTPLSALVSHQPLWERTDTIKQQRRAAAQLLAAVPDCDPDDQPPPLATTPMLSPAAAPSEPPPLQRDDPLPPLPPALSPLPPAGDETRA
eukprot:TRINITY_DN19450_c0_g1_i1.p1 TRINITY_DN19450_c0_g1~~TRINITY_DN19450_c0_g1_i1.p1  ORF type:complete len:507 (+),score=165.58 TRINITY_DN19450_c0_g1_i1:142-1521(+)